MLELVQYDVYDIQYAFVNHADDKISIMNSLIKWNRLDYIIYD